MAELVVPNYNILREFSMYPAVFVNSVHDDNKKQGNELQERVVSPDLTQGRVYYI